MIPAYDESGKLVTYPSMEVYAKATTIASGSTKVRSLLENFLLNAPCSLGVIQTVRMIMDNKKLLRKVVIVKDMSYRNVRLIIRPDSWSDRTQVDIGFIPGLYERLCHYTEHAEKVFIYLSFITQKEMTHPEAWSSKTK